MQGIGVLKTIKICQKTIFLSAIAESERIIKDLSQNGLKKIARMENLSQNELKQIVKMQDLSQDELEQIAGMRRIKDYKDMSRQDLLIALLRSKQRRAELRKSEDNNAEIKETKKFFNELRNRLSKEKIKKIRKKFCSRESIDEYLKELEQKDSLTEQEKREKKSYIKKLWKAEEYLKKLKEDLNRLEKHQYNDNEDID